jgi:hypothetical protein
MDPMSEDEMERMDIITRMGSASNTAAQAGGGGGRSRDAKEGTRETDEARSTLVKAAREFREQRLHGEYGVATRHVQLMPVSFIGYAIRIKRTVYVACEQCFSVCTFGLESYCGAGITCTHHSSDVWSIFKPPEPWEEATMGDPVAFASPFARLYHALSQAPDSSMRRGEPLPALGAGLFEGEEELAPVQQAIKPATVENNTDSCWFCVAIYRTNSQNKSGWRRLEVFDNRKTNKAIFVMLCPTHVKIFMRPPLSDSRTFTIDELFDIREKYEKEYGIRVLNKNRRMEQTKRANKLMSRAHQ